ncbi:type II secretion system protein GspL [Pollutimonas bauzanensis]|uniref:Type II secretion system protein L (GspL) n=1 Tax=Pollutimonas bauzanensis TaxID=658167 RepID=A0A1M5NUB6_9BURK|nr:type II secretion system protein GspL [Pollutimonas bauzanensis]SHG93122.1 type II secretion system protein L (GspL) [Pollutimonas bauzanensis]
MKHPLRLALPPLARLTPESLLPFALLDHEGRLLRSGELPLNRLAAALPAGGVQAILHPGDAIVVSITLPPLPAKRFDAAVQASVEPMTLSDTADLCIAHGPRAADGSMSVAWAERRALLNAWELLAGAGLTLSAIVPHCLALPAGDPHPDLPLALPVDERWLAALPRWSLAQAQWRPASQGRRWRGAGLWAGAAALLWLIGLQGYAAQLRNETRALQAAMEQAVRKAFPAIPVVIDPVKQAQGQRDALRLARGAAGEDDFMPLALAAAATLKFTDNHVAALHYENGQLTLTLSEGYTPPGNEAVLQQSAAVHALALQKDDKLAHTWHVRRAGPQAAQGARP